MEKFELYRRENTIITDNYLVDRFYLSYFNDSYDSKDISYMQYRHSRNSSIDDTFNASGSISFLEIPLLMYYTFGSLENAMYNDNAYIRPKSSINDLMKEIEEKKDSISDSVDYDILKLRIKNIQSFFNTIKNYEPRLVKTFQDFLDLK